MLVLLLFATCLRGSSSVIVSNLKSGSMCDAAPAPDDFFDSVLNYVGTLRGVAGHCKWEIYLTIDLAGEHIISYVILHPGLSVIPQDYNILDYYRVTVQAVDGVHACSQFPEPLRRMKIGEGLRVNCAINQRFMSKVSLAFIEVGDLRVAEISVHSYSETDEQKSGVLIYRGCFTTFPSLAEKDVGEFKECQTNCRELRFPIAAIEKKDEGKMTCHCGRDFYFEYEVKLDNCEACEPHFCGGVGFYSVYIVSVQLPFFYGCSSDPMPENTIIGPMSISKCLYYCDRANFSMIRHDSCGCTSLPPKVDMNPYKCSTECDAENRDVCGFRDDRSSVYGTCLSQTDYTLSCDRMLNCNEKYDKYGLCVGGCSMGFGGELCIEKVSNENLMSENFTRNVIDIVVVLLLFLEGVALWLKYKRVKV